MCNYDLCLQYVALISIYVNANSSLVGAAVDCWLFSTREKPWRHIPDTNGGFWESLKFWTGWEGVSKRRVVRGPGKSREEMVKEARSAYKRRDEEIAQRRVEAAASGANGEAGPRKVERSWWDASGFDGPVDKPAKSMSPVTEENDPLETKIIEAAKPPSKESYSLSESEVTLRISETTRSRDIGEEAISIREETDVTSQREKAITDTTPAIKKDGY